jgi:hypothetical protein
MLSRRACRLLVASLALLVVALPAAGQDPTFEPTVGQPGKDVVWVPTPQELVDRMLDMARVSKQDFLMDLGSGDGRTVIAAARRGLQAEGVEYNPDMVGLARRNAQAAGVGSRATFVQGDLFEADLSRADVITMFLLPSINLKLRPAILGLEPGTRIVSNTFTMGDWEADETSEVGGDCTTWCTALLWIVPATVEGIWDMPGGPLTLVQQFQFVSGSLGTTRLQDVTLRGAELRFTVNGSTYTGRVDDGRMTGTTTGSSGEWTAVRR